MDDHMPPLTSAIEAASIKMELPTEQKSLPVQYSSSASPLIDDDSGLPKEADLQSLHNQLKLSTYEYAALEEYYRTLLGQHRELRKLASAYHDVIRGSSSYEEDSTDLKQLRVEAGRDGLRAKALEADVLRPIVREAGGLEAFTSQTQFMQSLIEQSGGLHELQELVLDARKLRLRLDAVGGLQGLDHLVSEVNRLRADQQALAEARDNVDGPDGIKAKALKYDMLQQAFVAIQRGPAIDHPQAGPSGTPGGVMRPSSAAVPAPNAPVANAVATMNPDRARLLTLAPPDCDPDWDLYEPPPPPHKHKTKTGSNKMPLGPPRNDRQSNDQEYPMTYSKKRTLQDEPQTNIAKRPRVDPGRASALLQASLSHARPTTPRYASPVIKMEDSVSPIASDHDLGRGAVMQSNSWQARLVEFQGKPSASLTTTARPTLVDGPGGRPVLKRAIREPSLDSIYPTAQVVVKAEVTEDRRDHRLSNQPLVRNLGARDSVAVMVDDHPIALWIGAGDANSDVTRKLITIDDIPLVLAKFLAYGLNRYIEELGSGELANMPPNDDTCVLRYLLDGHRPSGQPQELRACRTCCSRWVRHNRPCALLQVIDGVRTVVFVPLREALRRGVDWTEEAYWVKDTK